MDINEPSTSGPPTKKNTQLTLKERIMVKNVYHGIRERNPELTTLDAAETCGTLTKISSRTVFRVLNGHYKENDQKKKQSRQEDGKK